jgi:uncharacterized membrane protein
MLPLSEVEYRYLKAVGLISALCLVMFVVRAMLTGVARFVYIPENLALAWLALLFAWLLVRNLNHFRWASWRNIGLSLLWLFFLPNAWYVLTDFIHVPTTGEISVIFDIVMISALVFSGFILGFGSLMLVHKELLKRFSVPRAHAIIGGVLMLSSFAIYLGRELRWNSWDIVADPGGIILNVSDRIVNPFGYPSALNFTLLFFLLLSVLYIATWQFIGLSTRPKK